MIYGFVLIYLLIGSLWFSFLARRLTDDDFNFIINNHNIGAKVSFWAFTTFLWPLSMLLDRYLAACRKAEQEWFARPFGDKEIV